MKKLSLGSLFATTLCACQLFANSIEFNEADYQDGTQLKDHSLWSSGFGNIIRKTGNGQIEIADDAWRNATYLKPISTSKNQAFEVSGVFHFQKSSETGNNDIFSLTINSKMKQSGALRMFLSRLESSNNYKVVLKTTGDTYINSSPIEQAKLGFTEGSNQSDPLEMTFWFKRGLNEKDWETRLILKNQKTQVVLLDRTDRNLSTNLDFYKTEQLFAGFSSSRGGAETGTTNRILENFSFSATQKPYTKIPEPRNAPYLLGIVAIIAAVSTRRHRQ